MKQKSVKYPIKMFYNMQTYIKTEDVEKFAFSLIKDSRHLKSAMKEMTRTEEDEFITRIVR